MKAAVSAGRAKARGRPVLDSDVALTREKIVKAAMEIVDTEGLSALSMRHLGASLGVDPMAIYYHLPNKAALYDAIVEAVMAGSGLENGVARAGAASGPASGSELSPIEQLRQMAGAYRDALIAHPNALPVIATRPVRTPASLRPVERMLAVISSLGFNPQESIAFIDVCAHYIMGWAQTYAAHLQGGELHDHGPLPINELSADEFPNLLRVLKETPSENPFAVEFDMGMSAILSGLLTAVQNRTASGPADKEQRAAWTADAD